MPHYRPYNEEIHQLGYDSYRSKKLQTLPEANLSEAIVALKKLKSEALKLRRNLNDIQILKNTIFDLIEKNEQLWAWCQDKTVSISNLFPGDEIELPELIAIVYMIQKGNAFVLSSSVDRLIDLLACSYSQLYPRL